MTEMFDLSNYDPNNIPEARLHPKGTEVRARISRMAADTDKNRTPYWMPWFEDADDPNIEDWNDYLPLPVADDTEKDKGKKLRKLKAFDESFQLGIFNGPFNVEDAKGSEGWVILGVGKNQDGGDANSVSKYLAPQS